MKVIYKYTANADGAYAVRGYLRTIHVDEQDSAYPTIWCEIDKDATVDGPVQILQVLGTGFGAPDSWTHVGSAICQSVLVWHVYEVKP